MPLLDICTYPLPFSSFPACANEPLLNSLEIFAFFMLTGIFSTLLIPETKRKSLEELSNEQQEGFIKGVAKKIETQDGQVIAQSSHL